MPESRLETQASFKFLPLRTLLVSLLFALAGAYLALLLMSLLFNWVAGAQPRDQIMARSLYLALLRGDSGVLGDAIGSWADPVAGPWRWLAVVLLLVALWALVRLANRDSRRAFHRHPGQTLAARVAALFLSLGIVGLPLSLAGGFVLDSVSAPGAWDLVARMAVGVVLCGLLYLVAAEGGWISSLAGEEKALGGALWRSLLPAGLLLLVVLLVLQIGTTFERAIWVFDEAAVPTRLGIQRLTLGLALFFGLPLAAVGGALVAMAPRRVAPGQRGAALVIPVALVVAMTGIGRAFLEHCRTAWEMNLPSLNEAASLPLLARPLPPRRALVLQAARGVPGIPVPQREKVQWFDASGEVDTTPETLGRLGDYLERRKGRTTFYTELAMEARRRVAARSWQIGEFRKICLANALAGGSLLNPLFLLVSLDHAPVTRGNREILELLSDDRFFVVNGTNALKMARIWADFGDIEAARSWFRRARGELTLARLGDWQVPQNPGLTRGRIRGRIRGIPSQGVRMGLYHLPVEQKELDISQFSHIKEAFDLPMNGEFAFDSLPAGRYRLILLLPPGLEGPFDVTGGGTFEIGPDHSVIDVGEIRVGGAAGTVSSGQSGAGETPGRFVYR